ncbi:MAG: protoheme IX farnesyltransferase, partial [Thermoguttaceae bacterium]|nr:protoheme IX farnesyltransferase [Thermoguttaceae bacterium]
PRIVGMVLFTMTVTALVAGPHMPRWGDLAHALAGSALVIAGAIALNQRIERRTDALMRRTASRPLPSGRMTTRQAARFGLVASTLGLAYLAATTPWTLVGLTLVSWVVYVWVYTPMKVFSAWQTPLGALAGAMPTLMGAAVAGHPGGLMAMGLFGVVYFWQFPHAMAIAWLYRNEFAAANLKVATVVDPSGRVAAVLAVIGATLLLPLGLLPWLAGAASLAYGVASLLLGLGYLASSIDFLRRTDDIRARRLLRVSLVYLPAVFVAVLWAARM